MQLGTQVLAGTCVPLHFPTLMEAGCGQLRSHSTLEPGSETSYLAPTSARSHRLDPVGICFGNDHITNRAPRRAALPMTALMDWLTDWLND